MTYSGSVLRNQPPVQFVVPDDRPPTHTIRLHHVGEVDNDQSPEEEEETDGDTESITSLGNEVEDATGFLGDILRSKTKPVQFTDKFRNENDVSMCAIADNFQNDNNDSMLAVAENVQVDQEEAKCHGNGQADVCPLSPAAANTSAISASHSPRRSPTKSRRKFRETAGAVSALRVAATYSTGDIDTSTLQKADQGARKTPSATRSSKSPMPRRQLSPMRPGKGKLLRSSSNASSGSDDNLDPGRKHTRASHGRQALKKKVMKGQSQEVAMSPKKRRGVVRVNSVPNIKSPALDQGPTRSPVRTLRKFKQKNFKKGSSFDSGAKENRDDTVEDPVKPKLMGLPTLDLNSSMSSITYQVDLNRKTPRKSKTQSVKNTTELPKIDLMDFEGVPDMPSRNSTTRRSSLGAADPRARQKLLPKRLSLNQTDLPCIFQQDAESVQEDSYFRVLQLLEDESSSCEDEDKVHFSSVPTKSTRKSTTESLKRKMKKDRMKEAGRPQNGKGQPCAHK